MKKVLLFLLLLTQFTFGQVNTSTVKAGKYQMNIPELGAKKDSAVVWDGVTKIMKILPVSEIKGTTNLDFLATPTGGTVFSSTGVDAVLPLATATNAGLQSPSDKSKLDGIANGATANQTDAYLLSRANHTGTQPISTVTGLQSALDTKVDKVAGERLINAAEITKLSNQSGTNTGDQDLSGLVVKNTAITGATNTKITYDSKGLVTGGTSLIASDIPTLNQNTTGTASTITGSISESQVTNLVTDLSNKQSTSQKNTANGYAGLGSDGKLISSQLPSITISDTFVTASQAAMLALVAETGDVAVRTDLNKSFILKGTNPTVLADWQELLTPTSAVTTVFGRNGAVAAQTGDYTADQITETATRKFQTANQNTFNDATSSIQTQLNSKQATITAGTTAQYRRGDNTWQTLDKTAVGLGNVDNTTDLNKPISTATQTALNGKQASGSYEPAFSKNTAFNKNFGTASGTVAEGNDSRINNGQTAYSWGNHAGLYLNQYAGLNIDVDAFNGTRLDRGSNQFWTNKPITAHNGGALFSIETHPGNYYSQLYFDTGNNQLRMRKSDAGVWGGWVEMLHSGNFNAYSPSLTGSGASGTWGVNISGNSNKASRLIAHDSGNDVFWGWDGKATFKINDTNFGRNVPMDITGNAVTLTGGNAGALITGNWSGSSYWGMGGSGTVGHQFVIDMVTNNTTGQSFMGASDITMKLGTKTVLESSNFSSYALPMTGGTITGQIRRNHVSSGTSSSPKDIITRIMSD